MTWFKVDDNYWSHPKVMFQSAEASGLWIRAASWSAHHLTDGHIPRQAAHMIMPRHPRTIDTWAAELEGIGLWVPNGTGWTFHDWHHYQPSRQAVEQDRERLRERQRAWRERRRDPPPTDGVSPVA